MKKRVIVQLCGGIGNQMFQYAAGRAIALRNDAALVLDTWSGFVRDREYHRHYELDPLPIQARHCSTWERLPTWLYRIEKKTLKTPPKSIDKKPYGVFINETAFEYSALMRSYAMDSSCYLNGYWQSPKYFHDIEPILLKELRPPTPKEKLFLSLGDQMNNEGSVALGVRLYEESSDPSAHALDGKVKTIPDINGAINNIRARAPNSKFYVFCTHHSEILDSLQLPPNSTFVTHDNGYEGTLQRLWLLAQCRHHVITNSSFYWWGAWLGQQNHEREQQVVLAADNFCNKDSLPATWETF